MNATEKIVKSLDGKLSGYKQPVTEISKTDKNEFIVNDTLMFDWDEISKVYGDGDESSSVDGLYCSLQDDFLILYFFEFKNFNLHDSFFDARKQLEIYLNNMEQCKFCHVYSKEIRKIKKKLVSKKVISLKTKPLESLILLHKILNNFGISSEELVSVKKEYYIVSKTPISGNRSNWHRRGRNREIFGFIDKIKPFPFIEVNHLSEKAFLSLINKIKINENLMNFQL